MNKPHAAERMREVHHGARRGTKQPCRASTSRPGVRKAHVPCGKAKGKRQREKVKTTGQLCLPFFLLPFSFCLPPNLSSFFPFTFSFCLPPNSPLAPGSAAGRRPSLRGSIPATA